MNSIDNTPPVKELNNKATTALLLVFGLGAVAVAAFASRAMFDGVFENNPFKYLFLAIPWLFVFHFGAIGLLFIFIAAFGRNNSSSSAIEFAKKLGRKSLSEQWKEGVIQDSNSEALAWSFFSFIYKSLLVLPSLALGIYDFLTTSELNLGLVFVIVPIYSIIKIIIARQRISVFGRSLCRIQKSFSPDGVKYQFESERGHDSITKYQVQLRSEKRTLVRSNKSHRLDSEILLKFEHEIVNNQKVSPQGRLTVDFTIPNEVRPSSSPELKEGIFWLLTIKGSRPGVDYFAEFLLPVKC